jgi:large subunit ribosomal protein L2
MGKNLIQQRRGKGSTTFRAPSFRYAGRAGYTPYTNEESIEGNIVDILHSAGHSAPLARVRFKDGEECLVMASLGARVGDSVYYGLKVEPKDGNTTILQNILEGTLVYNIEKMPGDGGKFARASGTFAKILVKTPDKVLVELPSRKQHEFNPMCRATIGIIAGGGRLEKPLVKAGNNYHKFEAKNKMYPHVCALSMNAVDHPFGGSRSSKKGKSMIAPRNAPPGRKVGLLRPKRSGRKN